MEKQKTIFKDKSGYFVEQNGERIYVKPIDQKGQNESKWTFTDGKNTYTPSQVQEKRVEYSSAYDPYALTDLLDWTAENTIGIPIKLASKTETGQKALPYIGKILSVAQPSKWYGTITGKGAPWSEKNTGFGDSKHEQALNTLTDWFVAPALVKGEGAVAKTVGKEATMQLASKGWSPAVRYVLGNPETKNILNEIIPGQLGWAPAQKITVFHRTDNPMFKIIDFTPERWDAKFHGAPKTGMWVSQKNDIGFLNKRPYEVILTEEVKKPIVQIGDISTTWKNKTRNKIFEYAKQNGADAVQFKNIKDNKTNGQNVDFIFSPSENLKIQILKKPLNKHVQGEDAVRMFKEYGGTPIPEGSINGEQLRKYVMEARERYGLMNNPNISDEEIAQALYKHTNELGKGSAAINSQGEPQLLFRGDTKSYTQLEPRISPEKLYEQKGTMDNSLGTLFLGEMPEGTGGDQGVAKYLNTAITTKAMPGTEAQTVFRPSQTGGSLEFDGKTWKGIYKYPSTIEKNTKTPVVVPEDASFLYSGKNGLYSVYKLPSRMATSGVNEINGFVVRTPAVRDMSYEMQVLEPAIPVQYADKFKWLTKSKPKLIEDKDGFPFIDYEGKQSSGLASGSEQGVVRELYRDQYSQLLKEAKEQNQGLLYSKPNTVLRREHNNYSYYALPNWNLKNAKHILPYDLRIPRNWSDPNIFRIAVPIGMGLQFLNNSQK